ncbi:hypothetical protein I3760_13G075300 [Carya illinoinensis]|uniref:Small ribosomal subunit protein bS18c n=1 Tax=Carya illinoinensis TaxID=32201 RepID=A0A8T1NHA6_CARIL|nr:uncharacterized protein LOC122293020 [Carya illinoinensis]KAG2673134.1 hypothetical protein I3760_13G075300 [Carya illinoinensis]KAG6631226.1 hypothetical protein CIPAW_13G076700 [Carya illinoinensis]KAG6681110.1 hypothetical protein I3842_13G075400 [Carya illinoinensis]
MKAVRLAVHSCRIGLLSRFPRPYTVRTLSTNATSGGSGIADNKQSNSFESADEFERRIFSDFSGGDAKSNSFFEKFDRLVKGRDRSGYRVSEGSNSQTLDGLDESFNTLSDGMDGKLKKAATYFSFDTEEIEKDDYKFRPDMNFKEGMTYETKDLDLRKPGVWKPSKRPEFQVTTKEVLKKADFRNVRFLANFITEAGIIIKRSKTGISAKAQRKVAREIKTARAFGLMPFTTMGTKSFVYGQTMESLDKDFEYESYNAHVGDDADGADPL